MGSSGINNIPPHLELDSLIEVMKVPEKIQPRQKEFKNPSSLLRSDRPERGPGMECGIHVQAAGHGGSGKDPTPVVPNIIVGKIKCRSALPQRSYLSNMAFSMWRCQCICSRTRF